MLSLPSSDCSLHEFVRRPSATSAFCFSEIHDSSADFWPQDSRKRCTKPEDTVYDPARGGSRAALERWTKLAGPEGLRRLRDGSQPYTPLFADKGQDVGERGAHHHPHSFPFFRVHVCMAGLRRTLTELRKFAPALLSPKRSRKGESCGRCALPFQNATTLRVTHRSS